MKVSPLPSLSIRTTITKSLSTRYPAVIWGGNNAAQQQPGALGTPPYIPHPYMGTRPFFLVQSWLTLTQDEQLIRCCVALPALRSAGWGARSEPPHTGYLGSARAAARKSAYPTSVQATPANNGCNVS